MNRASGLEDNLVYQHKGHGIRVATLSHPLCSFKGTTHRLFVQLTSLKVSEKWTDVTEGRFSWETDG